MSNRTISFSIVVPLYESAPYLPDLLASFANQHGGPYTVEYIFVDDGSPDDSGDIAQRWLDETSHLGHVIRQENQGVSAARNAGIEAARGEWIGLPDGDDFVGTHYLSATANALLHHGSDEVVLASTNVQNYDEATDTSTHSHVLRFKYADGTQLVDLEKHPTYIQSQAASAFFRRDLIDASGVRFTRDLHVAEDALFVAEYLLEAPSANVLFLPHAEYYYRKRAAGNSAVDTVRENPDFYFGRFERGYLPLFRRAAAKGHVPLWLDQLFLYDVRWFLPREANVTQKATWFTPTEKAEVLAGVAHVLEHVADRSIIGYNVTGLGVDHRCLLLALKGSPIPTEGVAKIVSSDRRGIELRYLFVGERPDERFTRDGSPLTPLTTKTRRLDVFDQRLLFERIVWLPAGSEVALQLNGRAVKLSTGSYQAFDLFPRQSVTLAATSTARRMWRRAQGRFRAEVGALLPWTYQNRVGTRGRADRLRTRRRLTLAQRTGRGRRFANAWILMDKVHAAGDSAEYLYRHLQQERPDVNAWFVLDRDSSDWARLDRDGFRLVAYGSHTHQLLLSEAAVVISTHLDVEMTEPMPLSAYPGKKRPWRYVYLEHGVMQHDLAIWFNRKPIDIITTASVDEQQSIVEDYSSYTLTSQQARLTGFPRHDEVARLAANADPAARNIVLFAPTWRHTMLARKTGQGELRAFVEPFEQTEFARNWLGLINDPALAEIAKQTGTRLVFLPHPNFRTQIDPGLMAPGVELMTSVDDVHELLTRCRSVVTDYSSIFFEAALAGADVSYFQFDHDTFLNGGHTYVPGYWSYPEHGLGPIGYTGDELVDILRRQLTGDGYAADREFFAARLKRTLPMVDGHSVERITAEVERLLA
ncbi:hypothetical protein LK09_02115 [Microbacterium mangrovi]|uniref:Glycosyltransferase 2-like domain-containing protein n=1 Tax=Microbacterium mangrovi TaxID=1348253 RepID=A0A0B2ACU8_9MICO|nr:glycosyltransferase [Microbacterium mangrovi]KHK99466.1 hypothetical protein LK09_02115 [Microbacterium mangrovi]